ncbi:MAG: hypothetical protein A2161_21845 [Candidatus Schekmanbacteria bacterium RBG_13_48_7]|uniref:RsbT co-antagonist protein RsbRD N-terminal domain-containing protein n=1 Tax=Candidatus Schekmanbacteria bacterium RBG_13_48_7 TaxID=1817878 RepID=A0A1F7S0Q2_9BACT|nr:MAG: hypothetical protein A2161_21845 [Candidatus Schekmanbacteria bacterium RBG_13_48_7]
MLEKLISEKQTAILDRWFNLILETYPSDASQFLKNERDRFKNPVGYTLATEIKTIFQGLLQETITEKLHESLMNIIKIQSVQDFFPSEAITFIFLLKKAIREELQLGNQSNGISLELPEFESKIDILAGLAFDKYMESREKIFEVRINEIKARSSRLIERLNLISEKRQNNDSTNSNT